MFLLLVKLRSCYGCLMGVEPLPDIRDGIVVERLVKTVRYVADMRRCQYVVQRPEGVRRRQRLNVEYVDRGDGARASLPVSSCSIGEALNRPRYTSPVER